MILDCPVLLGDIGGTNARFAVLLDPAQPPCMLPKVLTAGFPDPASALRSILSEASLPRPRSAILAIAAPIESTSVPLTNASWVVDAAQIGAELDLARVHLVNDYVPVAVALAGLDHGSRQELARLGPAVGGRPGTCVALGPGTGLGAAALAPVGDRFAVLSTEAGHADFGPADEAEAALWPSIEKVGGRVTAETLLSGPGILRLYGALARSRGAPLSYETPDGVTAAGASGADEVAAATLALFAKLLGRFAGDLALIFGATGGIYLASGIAPRIADLLGREGFREAFERKAPHTAWIGRIPTWVVTHPEPAILGLSLIARTPARFAFNGRGWPS